MQRLIFRCRVYHPDPVAPPSRDVFAPAPDATFTKGEVNRAARLMCRFYAATRPPREGNPFDDFALADLIDAMTAVTWWRGLHARPLTNVAVGLRYHVGKENALVDGRIDVTQRLKRKPTIFNKLERESTMELTQMQDIGGVRARLPDLKQLNAVSRRLRKNWTIIRSKDYIDGPPGPKESGYRALHHVVRRHGRDIEVQLRTIRQDAWANQVEEDSRLGAVGYKFGRGGEDVHDYYRTVSEAFAAMDRGEELGSDLVARLNLRYQRVQATLNRHQDPPRGTE